VEKAASKHLSQILQVGHFINLRGSSGFEKLQRVQIRDALAERCWDMPEQSGP
jgi:hypothetical protein